MTAHHTNTHTHTRIMVTRPPTLIRCRMNIHMNVVCFVYFQCRIFLLVKTVFTNIGTMQCGRFTIMCIHTIKIKIHSHIHSGECFSQNLSVSLFLFGMHRNHYSHMVGFCALHTPNGKVFNRHYSHCNMWVHAFMTAFIFILAFISLMISDFRMFGAFYGK